jgi:predicted ATPase
MAGARFVRSDLHVHTYPDTGGDGESLVEYIRTANLRDVGVLGITDHNSVRNVRALLAAAEGSTVLVLPGIEITTHQGHLLGLFAPSRVGELEEFAGPGNLGLRPDPHDGSLRSSRSILHLLEEIHERGGLAIPAHIDRPGGITESMTGTELTELLAHPGLAALEFAKVESLAWFTSSDSDTVRRAAWTARLSVPALAERGLARIMSSDAHSCDQLGRDRARRTLTRLRLDALNFTAVLNALVHNPKARCKAEADLPPTYPRVLEARFEGGFLDDVVVNFSDNLTCFIGGRGSGKSTALIAIRAALGAQLNADEDPDDQDRMPERTTVKFIDRLGNERVAVRQRGTEPVEQAVGASLSLTLADLAQDESGRLVRRYQDEPEEILAFLDKFCDLRKHNEAVAELLDRLSDNAGLVSETAVSGKQKANLEKELVELEASLEAAQQGKIEAVAKYATVLATEGPLLDALKSRIDEITNPDRENAEIDIDSLAQDSNADLTQRPAKDFVEGEGNLRESLATLKASIREAHETYRDSARDAVQPSEALIQAWRARHAQWNDRLRERREELQSQGLKVQVGELDRITQRTAAVRRELTRLRGREERHRESQRERSRLLKKLAAERKLIYERRRATLKKVVSVANSFAVGLTIEVSFEHQGVRNEWSRWLASQFGFRAPRVRRLAEAITPKQFAELMLKKGRQGLVSFEVDGERFFVGAPIDRFEVVFTWPTIFELQTMKLDDRPHIRVREGASQDAREFDHLSTGQQRSVLLSLMLCAERLDPLVLDQPEDHLDAGYIASAVVQHLEHAKERRQVILATHSPNLTVLGDAELVVPMHAAAGRGAPQNEGAVDRPETRQQVCNLLEGGEDAYRRRGERYGFRVTPIE